MHCVRHRTKRHAHFITLSLCLPLCEAMELQRTFALLCAAAVFAALASVAPGLPIPDDSTAAAGTGDCRNPLHWRGDNTARTGEFVDSTLCCRSKYGQPISRLSGPQRYRCQDVPANSPVPLGAFGCNRTGAHTCAGNAVCMRAESTVMEPEARCLCASVDDPTDGSGNCLWAAGSVPTGKRVIIDWTYDEHGRFIEKLEERCETGRTDGLPVFVEADRMAYVICVAARCSCASPDDPLYHKPYDSDVRCADCWTHDSHKVPNGMRIDLANAGADACISSYMGKHPGSEYGLCSCPSVDDPLYAINTCAWGKNAPYGARVWEAAFCSSGYAVRDGDMFRCECASPDDPKDNFDGNITCRWIAAGSAPHKSRVPKDRVALCGSGYGVAVTNDSAVVECTCPSYDDEAIEDGDALHCAWGFGMVPPGHRVHNVRACFFQPSSNETIKAMNGRVTCPAVFSESGEMLVHDENLFRRIKELKDSSESDKYWEFGAGSPEEAAYRAISHVIVRSDDIRALYASQGVGTGDAAQRWLSRIEDVYFAHTILNLVSGDDPDYHHPACKSACVERVLRVLRSEFNAVRLLHSSLMITKLALDTHFEIVQANIDGAKLTVSADDATTVVRGKLSTAYLNLALSLFSQLPYVGTPLSLWTSMFQGIGEVIAAKEESYDPDAPLEAAAAQLKSVMQDRHMALYTEYAHQLESLAENPLRVRMFGAVLLTVGMVSDYELVTSMKNSTAAVRTSLVRILMPAKWQICFSEDCRVESTHDSEFPYKVTTCPCGKNSNFNVARSYPVGDLVDHPPGCQNGQCGGYRYAWVCPNGRYEGGTLASLDMYTSAGLTGASTREDAERRLIETVLKGDQGELQQVGFGTFLVPSTCSIK